jgi:hypothetical protein
MNKRIKKKKLKNKLEVTDDMSTLVMDNISFKDFLKQNKEKIRKITEENTVRNSKGEVVITKDDSWRNETEWDDNN